MKTPIDSVFSDIRERVHLYDSLPERFLALDTETTGTRLHHGHKPFAVSACNQDGTTFFWRCPVDPKTREPQWKKKQLEEIVALVLSYDYFVFHNAKFDIRALSKIPGLRKAVEHIIRLAWKYVRDTLLYSHVMDSGEEHGLKALSAKYLGIPADDQDALQKAVVSARRGNKKGGYVNAEEVEWDYWLAGKELEAYSIQDAKRTALLYAMYVEAVKSEDDKRNSGRKSHLDQPYQFLTWQVCREHLLMPQVYAMEERGIRLRRTTLVKERDRFTALGMVKSKDVASIAYSAGFKEFNPRSSPQLQALLYDRWKLKPLKATKQGFSVDAETLKYLLESFPQKSTAGRFLSALLDSRRAYKACDYLNEYESLAIPEPGLILSDGKPVYILHPSFNQVGTHTTRFSSSNPNAQNVSTKEEMPLREVFGPRPGHYWIDADYDNLEMRLFAYACGEKALIKAFEAGESVHLVICEELHGPMEKWPNLNKENWKKSPEYKSTKNGNFSLIYGACPSRANATYGVPDAFDRIRKRFKKLAGFMQETIKKAEQLGYVETMFGYRLSIPRDRAYSALNYYIQGTAGCVMKYAILGFNKIVIIQVINGEIVMTVHDEKVSEWDNCINPIEAGRLVKSAMEAPGKIIGIPLPVSVEVVRSRWTTPEILTLSV